MSLVRAAGIAAAVVVAALLQVALVPHLAWRGIGPDLTLLVVVAAALTWGAQSGLVMGFAAGAFLDLVPPSDHLVGRWALAFMVVGYLAGRVRAELPTDRPAVGTTLATVAACSFVGTSVFAFTGLLLGDSSLSVGEVLLVIAVGVIWDLALTPVVVPPLLRGFARLAVEPGRLR